MPETTILLVRHGETDWNAARRIQGQTNSPLNDRGRAQANALADELAGEPITAVYSSDLDRARETAEILAGRLDLPVVVDPALRERNFGSWEGKTVDELEARWPGAWARWRDGNEGEGDVEDHLTLAARVRDAVHRLAAAHPGERILVVAHGGAMRVILMDAEGLPYPEERRRQPPIANCDVSRIAVLDGTVRALD
ncbi:MAG TPA: histidine phosphatase family protein [Gaiellaceae bacterium]|nr:histidine phosphatase family protein [Gaiellaceae bacterium]